MKYYLLIVICFLISIFLVSNVSGEVTIPSVKLGSCAQLIQTCTNCSFVNITGIDYPAPNSTSAFFNFAMAKNINVYNYTFCDNQYLGTYAYHTIGNPNGALNQQTVTYQVTATGQILDNSKAILYIFIFGVALLLLITSIISGMFIPSDHKRDEMTGYIIAMSNLKYVKIFCWAFAYVLVILVFYFAYIISFSFLDMDYLASLFKIAFYTTAWGSIIFFPIFTYVLLANAVRDNDIGKQLSEGLRIR